MNESGLCVCVCMCLCIRWTVLRGVYLSVSVSVCVMGCIQECVSSGLHTGVCLNPPLHTSDTLYPGVAVFGCKKRLVWLLFWQLILRLALRIFNISSDAFIRQLLLTTTAILLFSQV